MKAKKIISISLSAAMLALTGCSKQADGKPSATTETSVTLGAVVTEDSNSPTGYTVTFAYDGNGSEKTIETIAVTGPFQYVDPEQALDAEGNQYSPDEYKNGMYATNYAPAGGMEKGWGYTKEMSDEDGDGVYTTSFPISSGSFAYGYVIQYEGEEEPVTVDDPANPSPAKKNPDSITETGDVVHSIVYGKWDADKQSESLNLDYVLPVEEGAGEQTYVSYTGSDGEKQYLGVYVPDGYDAERDEPYKTIYMSHGGGGNETDWFAMGHADNIMDNLLAEGVTEEAVIVTMDNAHYEWDFAEIEDNVLNYIIPYVEENYNVSSEVKDRAFCGLSMGGMTTMNMYFDHPTEFGYFGIFSGTDMRAVKETEGLDEPIVMAAVGTCDIASEKILLNDNPEALKKYEDLVRWADENDMSNIHAAGYYEGAHDWFVWSQCFYHFATEYLWK